MNTQSDWQAVQQKLTAEDRLNAGEPPTAEEMLAYTRGELSAEEEARIQERLVHYPELVRTLTAAFPGEGAEPGDPDYLSDDEFAAHWTSMQQRMQPKTARVLPFWQIATAIAATLAIVFGGLLWQERSQKSTPRVLDDYVLYPDLARGPGPAGVTVTPQGDAILLVIPVLEQFRDYRLEIVSGNEPVWRSGVLARGEREAFSIVVPRTFLRPGRHQVVLIGIEGTREEPLATYTVRVPAQPR